MEASEDVIFVLDKRTTKNNRTQCLSTTSDPRLKLIHGGESEQKYSQKDREHETNKSG